MFTRERGQIYLKLTWVIRAATHNSIQNISHFAGNWPRSILESSVGGCLYVGIMGMELHDGERSMVGHWKIDSYPGTLHQDRRISEPFIDVAKQIPNSSAFLELAHSHRCDKIVEGLLSDEKEKHGYIFRIY